VKYVGVVGSIFRIADAAGIVNLVSVPAEVGDPARSYHGLDGNGFMRASGGFPAEHERPLGGCALESCPELRHCGIHVPDLTLPQH